MTATMLRGLGLGTRLVFAAAVAAIPGAALASDYSNVCRTADGLYEIDDGTLYRTSEVDQPGREIHYVILSEILVRRETGYCESDEAKGQRFDYQSKTSVLRIKFDADGRSIETTALCELAADGLPAAYNCDRQVVVSKEGSDAGPVTSPPEPPPAEQGNGLWMHNGSIMRLEASGDRRRFVYEVPRKGMRAVGAAEGTLLFEGERDGERYRGTARVFAKGCRPATYKVEGSVSADERTVVLTGRAPRIADNCRIKGYRPDRLVFTYAPQG